MWLELEGRVNPSAGCKNGTEIVKISALFLQTHKGFPLHAWRRAEIFSSMKEHLRAKGVSARKILLHLLNNQRDHLMIATGIGRYWNCIIDEAVMWHFA